MSDRILLATLRDDELWKMHWSLEGLDLIQVEAPELQPMQPSGLYRQQAEQRAVTESQGFDGWVLAARGGMSIPSLGGEWDLQRAPGAHGREKASGLLAQMADLPDGERTAYWVQTLALARHGRIVESWQCSGVPGSVVRDLPQVVSDDAWFHRLWFIDSLNKLAGDLTRDEFLSIDIAWRPLKAQLQSYFRYPEYR